MGKMPRLIPFIDDAPHETFVVEIPLKATKATNKIPIEINERVNMMKSACAW